MPDFLAEAARADFACGLPPAEEVPEPVIVYPDPPLSAEEEKLFIEVAPRVGS